jgi:hypothetical protein
LYAEDDVILRFGDSRIEGPYVGVPFDVVDKIDPDAKVVPRCHSDESESSRRNPTKPGSSIAAEKKLY